MLSPKQALAILDALAARSQGDREDHQMWAAAVASLRAAIAPPEAPPAGGNGSSADGDEVVILRAQLEDALQALEAAREAPAGDTLTPDEPSESED